MRTSDIAEQPLIFPKTGFMRQVLDKQFRPFRSRLRISMELPSVGMIKQFVAAGLGVSIISESFARDEVRAGQVKLIPISDMEVWRELGIRLPPGPHAAALGFRVRFAGPPGRRQRIRRHGSQSRAQALVAGTADHCERACWTTGSLPERSRSDLLDSPIQEFLRRSL